MAKQQALVPFDKGWGIIGSTAGGDVIKALTYNLGGQPIRPFDLPRIKVPGGDTKFWTVPSIRGDESVERIDVLE